MKLTILVLLCIWWAAIPAWAATIGELLEAAAHQPNVEMSELMVREGNLRFKAASAALYPELDLFGKVETYNSPTNLRPMPPTEAADGGALPFSHNILRYGLSFQIPLYIARIYRLREKMNLLARKSAVARQINLVSREAAVVSLNSSYHYLEQLNKAVDARLKSLTETRADAALKVKNGRSPGAELMKIDNSVIALDEQKNDLAVRMLNVRRDLRKFTGLMVRSPVGMQLAASPVGNNLDLIGIKLQKIDLAAQKKEEEQVRARRFPKLSLYGTISGNDGEAYNTNSHIFRSYNFIGLGLTMPLFDKRLSVDEDIARVQMEKAAKKLLDIEIELSALEKNLKERLPIVNKSRQLAGQSLENSKQLLKIARISYDAGRTTTEEYLRYEVQVFSAQANLARAVDARWQIITKQAVLYGTDLRGVVR